MIIFCRYCLHMYWLERGGGGDSLNTFLSSSFSLKGYIIYRIVNCVSVI